MATNLPSTPWLSACDAMNTALDWLCDIHRIRGSARDQAIEQANHAFDQALSYLEQLADPRANPQGAQAFATTRSRVEAIATPIRAGLSDGARFRRVELRDIADRAHADRRRLELASQAAIAPSRAGMSAPTAARRAILSAAA